MSFNATGSDFVPPRQTTVAAWSNLVVLAFFALAVSIFLAVPRAEVASTDKT